MSVEEIKIIEFLDMLEANYYLNKGSDIRSINFYNRKLKELLQEK